MASKFLAQVPVFVLEFIPVDEAPIAPHLPDGVGRPTQVGDGRGIGPSQSGRFRARCTNE
ncbi:hypothetical protein [Deinococcus xinjiangensis]|uniref:hypothetical protein n=1 Tax=Deinococcus xinjiangensis TaxID=457454 RepID=UPI0033659F8B